MTGDALPTQQIQISEAFSYGWRKLMARPAPWVIMAVVAVLTGLVMSWLSQITSSSPGEFIFGLASFVLTQLVGYLMVIMSLDAVRGTEVAIPTLGDHTDRFVTYLVTIFLFVLGVGFGLVFLIVPGIMFLVAYYFCGLIVADRGSDPIAALREARALSKGKRWPLFGAGLVALLVILLGTIAFFVGIFLAIPVVTMAAAHIYLQLRGEPIAE